MYNQNAYASDWRKNNRSHINAYRREYTARMRAYSRTITSAYTGRFIACDGEGINGIPDNWISWPGMRIENSPKFKQDYVLLRIGADAILYDNDRSLSSEELLEFIYESIPHGTIPVGYYFSYDVSMILRNLPASYLYKIIENTTNNWTFYKQWAIKYVPRHVFSIGRVSSDNKFIPKSSKSIWDVGQFFQCSFFKAINQWNIADTDTINKINEGKENRASFTSITDEIKEYNRLECELLEKLMTAFREVCIETDCVPTKWEGPGNIASVLLKRYDAPSRKKAIDLLGKNASKKTVENFYGYAMRAYYGGRFELTHTGKIFNIYENDINSAYPAAMLHLPCLEHVELLHDPQARRIWDGVFRDHCLYYVQFDHREEYHRYLCNIPIRMKEGHLIYPHKGIGWYFGIELEAARRAGTTFQVTDWYEVKSECNCRPFTFIEDIYLHRKQIGKSNKGYALKLGMNSTYGKLVQRIGSRPFYNPLWAGLITAYTRSWIIDAYNGQQSDIVMIATDGIYSTNSLKNIKTGEWLGEWEAKQHDTMFAMLPGIYNLGGTDGDDIKYKTRGIRMQVLRQHFPSIEQSFQRFLDNPRLVRGQDNDAGGMTFNIPVQVFHGIKLACAHGKPEDIGHWQSISRALNMDWTNKRTMEYAKYSTYIRHFTLPGHEYLSSTVWTTIGEDLNDIRKLTGELPDPCLDGFDELDYT